MSPAAAATTEQQHRRKKRRRPSSIFSSNNDVRVPVIGSIILLTANIFAAMELYYLYFHSARAADLLFFTHANNNLQNIQKNGHRPSLHPPLSPEGESIDNFYERKHIPTKDPVPIIVGGSDGSGTRAFAQLLRHLGVPMVMDDLVTLDVHAESMFGGQGWPVLVTQVLNVTHSAYYNASQLPESLLQTAGRELSTLLQELEHRALDNPLLHNQVDKQINSGISFGFKAPISQLLLPIFRSVLPKLKFLHIVRDGRDIAVSNNQSPVKKFYDTFYPDERERDLQLIEQGFRANSREKIQAMQLWNDWNSQVHRYGMNSSDGVSFDYLLLRTEDLLDHSFETTLKLADFVGSQKILQEICCISQMTSQDLGASLKGNRAEEPWTVKREAHGGVDRDEIDFFLDKAGQFNEMMNNRRNSNNANLDQNHRRLEQGSTSVHLRHTPAKNIRQEGHTKEDAPDNIKLRYGKWKSVLENDSKLLKKLHSEGSRALQLFGYEPAKRFMDTRAVDFSCDAKVIC